MVTGLNSSLNDWLGRLNGDGWGREIRLIHRGSHLSIAYEKKNQTQPAFNSWRKSFSG